MKKSRKLILGFIALGVVALFDAGVVLAESQTNLNQPSIAQINSLQELKGGQSTYDIIDSSDYDAWIAAVSESEDDKQPTILKNINHASFLNLAAYYRAVKIKDFATARKLADELGFRFGHHNTNGNRPESINNWRNHQPSVNYIAS